MDTVAILTAHRLESVLQATARGTLIRRFLGFLAAVTVACLGIAAPADAIKLDAAPVVTCAFCDDTATDRGPPVVERGRNSGDAVDHRSHGRSARPTADCAIGYTTYDTTTLAALVDTASGTTRMTSGPRGADGRAQMRSDIAANTAARSCSFTGSTAVLMADGTKKPIEDVRVGDKVIATDPETGEQVAKTVEHVFVHNDTVTDLIVDGEVITTTEDHPFWSVTDQRFERADELSPGEKVLGADGRVITVSGLRLGTSRAALAYNLSVEGIHTYHVGQAEILVHNVCPWSIRSRLKAAGPGTDMGLPSSGKIRFVPERGYNPSSPLPRGPQNGYIDRFGNEWVVGPSQTPGHPFEWDVQPSPRGREQLGWLSRDGRHVNVSPFGEVTH